MTRDNLPLLNPNGVFLTESKFSAPTHVDSSSLLALMDRRREFQDMHDFGVVSLFANRGFLPYGTDVFQFRSERMFLDKHEFTWGHPTGGSDWMVVEVLSSDADLGRAGEKFRVKMSSRKYDNLWVVGSDKALPYRLVITTDPILPAGGNHYIYTFQCKHANNDDVGYPRELLTPDSVLFGFNTLDSEYNATYSSLPEMETGERRYMATVGKEMSQLHYTVTREGAMLHVGDKTKKLLDDHLKVIEMYQFRPGSLGYDFQNLSDEEKLANFRTTNLRDAYMFASGRSAAVAERAFSRDTVLSVWVPKIEAICIATLQSMVDSNAFYNPGGQINIDGVKNTGPAMLGLFHQLMLGHKLEYSIQSFNIGLLESVITSRLQGRMKYDPISDPQMIEVRTGRGGISLVQAALGNKVAQTGQFWNAEPYISSPLNSPNALLYHTPKFMFHKMSNNMATLKFVYDPSLDPMEANPLVNPIVSIQGGVGGNRLSSYMFFIEDLAAGMDGANVKELLYGPDYDVWGMYENGRLAYPGSPTTGGRHAGSRTNPGFSVFLHQRSKGYHLVDPTRSLVIRPLNPETGRPLFGHIYDR